MTAKKIINKQLQNATRNFKILWVRQERAVKKVIKWIIKNKTCIVQKMYNKEYTMRVNKFRESISNHLWNINLQPIVEQKAERLIKKANGYKEWNILAGDASDIFKPNAYKMEKIGRIRDWSSWLLWNWYIMYWININWITHQLEIKDNSIEYIWSELREDMLKKSAKVVDPKKTIAVFDRGHDNIDFIDMLNDNKYKYVIRWKKNRIVKLCENWKNIKVSELSVWKYNVKLEQWTYAYLYIIKSKKNKNPIILYSNIDFEINEESLEIYKKRRKVEEDYKKHKEFWLEEVRLMSFNKIQNIVRLVQFIIMIWQSIYNDIMNRLLIIPQKLFIYYKIYCKKMCLTFNPMSMLSFISENIWDFKIYKSSDIPQNTIFWNRWRMKKVGLI